ncbi:MAG: TIGR03643 family protein [Verrucomicrobiota bacterium]
MSQKDPTKLLSPAVIDQVIALAWADRASFDDIKKRFGLSEPQVIRLMRRELKASSFRCWRKRVSGRVTKHRKLLKTALQSGKHGDMDME